jgi:hypothetical protein
VSGLFISRWGLYMGLSYVAFIVHMVVLLIIAGYLAEAPLVELPKFKKTFALLSVFFFLLTILAGVYRVALYMLGMPQRG